MRRGVNTSPQSREFLHLPAVDAGFRLWQHSKAGSTWLSNQLRFLAVQLAALLLILLALFVVALLVLGYVCVRVLMVGLDFLDGHRDANTIAHFRNLD